MMVALDGPRYFYALEGPLPDQETERIGFNFGGARAEATGVTRVAATPHRFVGHPGVRVGVAIPLKM
jgi:hypothetical protein